MKDCGGRCGEKQEGKQGQWHQESPFKEVLKQIKRSADTVCGLQRMRRAYNAKKSGTWKSFKEDVGRKESLVSGPLKEFGKLVRRWQWRMSAA